MTYKGFSLNDLKEMAARERQYWYDAAQWRRERSTS